jgi:hypothetical protein
LRTPDEVILIDDDPLIHMAWEIAASAAAKRVRCFSVPAEFFASASHYESHVPIYVDYHFGNGEDGERISREIAELGFDNIYLATAYPPDFFSSMPWLKGIVGKEPPWSPRRGHLKSSP